MAFPQDILDLRTELDLGAWTDITGYTYGRDAPPVTITRGRPDEASQVSASSLAATLDNRDGRFSPRNPNGAYYGTIARNTPIRLSVPEGSTYLRMEDDNTSFVSAPDTAGLSITGSMEIQIDLALTNWSDTCLASKYVSSGNQRSWVILLNSSGTIQFRWSSDGTGATKNAISTDVTPLGRFALKVTVNTATGDVNFYTAATIAGSWAQLGTTVNPGAGAIFDSTAPVKIGHNSDWVASPFIPGVSSPKWFGINGKVFAFKILSGIGGTVKASPDFTAATPGNATLTDAQSNVWTVNGTAEFSSRKYRFHGEVPSWPQRWDPSGTDVHVPIQAAGLLRRLGQGTAPIGSAMYRAMTRAAATLKPAAYWPGEDGSNSTQIASGMGGPAMQVTGPVTFAADTSFLCSDPLPTVGASTWSGNVPRYSGGTDAVTRFLMRIPATGGVDTAYLVRVFTNGAIRRLDLQYTTAGGGGLRLRAHDTDEVSLFDTGYVAFAADGDRLRVSMELRKNGADIDYSITVLAPGDAAASGFGGTLAAAAVGHVTKVMVNPAGSDWGTLAVGHMSVQSTWDTLFDLGSPLAAWAGETAGNRFVRLCQEEGIPYRAYGHTDLTRAMGAQTPQALTALLQECEDADRGMLSEPRQALALGYRTRRSLENQTAAVTLSYAAADLGDDPLEPEDDDQRTVNDVTVTRSSGGSSSRQALTSGALSTAAPPAGVGPYATSVENNVWLDSMADDQAGWILHVGTADEPRYPVIPVSLARSEIAGNATKYAAVQDTDIGDYVAVTGPPAWLPPGPIKQIVAGMTEQLGGHVYKTGWNGIPESPYEVGIAGSGAATDQRVDTDGSSLHANITAAATSMSVDTAAGNALWTTAAAEFPFDVLMGGEQITVTAITGASSPQTFTITRSANGVVKAHTAGEAITVAVPCTVALDDPY